MGLKDYVSIAMGAVLGYLSWEKAFGGDGKSMTAAIMLTVMMLGSGVAVYSEKKKKEADAALSQQLDMGRVRGGEELEELDGAQVIRA